MRHDERMEKATFAAGCFWGVESVFEQVDGVIGTRVGYTGGTTDHPTYRDVCSHRTGHAEAVEVTFDPGRVTYDQLLHIFWMNHDPTQLNRQGPDVGDNYRSAIFFHSPQQEAAARRSKDELEASGRFSRPIVTQIVPATRFWEAEDYHQKYYSRRGIAAACHL
jgi:peptide-methionine (S)-S-oxide reductase